MKKVSYCLICLVLCVSGIVLGQEEQNTPKKVTYGVDIGLNISTIAGDQTGEVSSKKGFYGGVILNVLISKDFTFESGLYYSQLGADFEDYIGLNITGKYKFDYIQVPIKVFYQIPSTQFFIGAGGYVGFNVKDKIEFDKTVNQINETSALLESMDLGGTFQVQYRTQDNLFFGAGFSRGFTQIRNLDQYNQTINIGVGYLF